MSPLTLVLIATGVIAGTGLLALLLFRVPRVATSIAVLGALVGGTIGLWAVVTVLGGGFAAEVSTPWAVPGGGLVVGKVHVQPPEGTFPAAATFVSDLGDPLTRGTYEPWLLRTGHHFSRLRFLQQGNLHIYLLYVLAAVIVGLTWVAARDGSAW